jgi:hypothetical protein
MRRRDFVTLVGGTVMARPLAARAEQPVIGILATASAEANAGRLRAFHQGLHLAGYVEEDNVKIEYAGPKTAVDCRSSWRSWFSERSRYLLPPAEAPRRSQRRREQQTLQSSFRSLATRSLSDL